jgi:hypothetical protein
MNPAKRYLLTLLSGACAISLLNVLLAAYTQPLVGDLTRIGELSERQFGWQIPQPVLTPTTNATPVAQSDVVIVGDSFSRLGLWQGELEKLTGLTSHTLLLGPGQCIDLNSILALPVRPGATLIIESVERLLASRLSHGAGCLQPSRAEESKLTQDRVGLPNRSPFEVDSDIGFKLKTIVHDLLVLNTGRTVFGRVKVAQLPQAKFSSADGRQLLYLADDDAPENLLQGNEDKALQTLVDLKSRLAEKHVRLQFLLAPNKSSMYLATHQHRAVVFSKKLVTAGLSDSDVVSELIQVSANQLDFYLPNDTHWGNRGYQAAARIVASWNNK